MGYDQFATSAANSVPVELYHFRYGPGKDDVLAYTNSERPISIVHEVGADATVYTPTPITHSDITESGTMDKKDMSIQLPAATDVARLFQGWPPSQVVRLTIYETELGDETKEVLIAWTGRVLGSTISANRATLRCESLYTGLQRNGVKRHYQYGCPHQLYGPFCKADKATATYSTTVSGLTGAELTLPENWNGSVAAAKFVGGYVTWDQADGRPELLSILKSVSETTLLLAARPVELFVGGNVKLVLGCNHTLLDCQTLHDNAPNFGGCPFIPTDNPIGIRNNFY